MKKAILFSLIAVLVSFSSLLAQVEVSGTVYDETGAPFIGVNVVEQGTTNGTLTDINGAFSINVNEGSIIQISSVGYKTMTFNVADGKSLTVNLERDVIGIDQVVVSASKRRERILDAPASVTVIGTEEVENNAGSLTVTDNLRKTPGVDIMQTGLVSSNVNIRGFNNIFSGAMLTMVDNRIARVPSLRVNAYQLIPVNPSDIESMEIVRGPASALYGPNAADGVLHIVTKSPLSMEEDFETTVSFMAGSRSVWKPEIRHAGKISDKVGYKISGSYMQGHDWPYFDPREPRHGDTVVFGSVQNGQDWVRDTSIPAETFRRDFFIQNFNVDGRIDIAPTNNVDIILSGGLAQTNNLELTGLGAGQGRNWNSYYAQARFRYKRLFVNYFMNGSDAGDTYLIPQNPDDNRIQLLVDKSKLHVLQVQHSSTLANNALQLVYGVDGLFTRPNTEGTINGRFEDDDNINQFGVYGQADYDITEKWKVLGALRIDYMDQISEVQFSPRAALVFRPTQRHTVRMTYNRAYSAPTSLNLSLDLSNGTSPAGFAVRGIGNPNGYEYSYNDATNAIQYLSHYDPSGTWYDYNNTSTNHVWFDAQMAAIGAELGQTAGIDPAVVTQIINSLLVGIGGDTGTIMNVNHLGVDLITLLEQEQSNPYAAEFDPTTLSNPNGVESTITQTMELGYKGIIKDKLYLQVDAYYTQIQNYISPLTNVVPMVIFDPNQLFGALENPGAGISLQQNLANSGLDPLLTGLLDGNPNYGDGVANGTAYDELVTIIQGANAQLGFGNVSPDDPIAGNDILLTYVNLGTIDVAGIDLGFTYVVNDDITVSGAASFVNKDRIPLLGAAGGFVALNAPRWKTSLAFDHTISSIGLGYGVNWRWQDAFPANSAVYVGEVFASNLIDVRLHYRPKWSEGTVFGLEVQNIANYRFQRFPGTPQIGRMVFAKVAHTF